MVQIASRDKNVIVPCSERVDVDQNGSKRATWEALAESSRIENFPNGSEHTAWSSKPAGAKRELTDHGSKARSISGLGVLVEHRQGPPVRKLKVSNTENRDQKARVYTDFTAQLLATFSNARGCTGNGASHSEQDSAA
jgi:hypothetical protein